MRAARVGAMIRNSDGGPPWIVVDHSIESVVASKWPGRLWEVEVLETTPEQPTMGANYTRAISVRVIAERPIPELFGAHGPVVCRVIEKAGALAIDDAPILLSATHPLAREACSRVWSRWLSRPETENGENADTLAVVSGGANARSPIGCGLTVLHSVLVERIRKLLGDEAFIFDEEGNQEFAPQWAKVADVFLHAAMAYGAPEFVSAEEMAILTAGWQRRYAEELTL